MKGLDFSTTEEYTKEDIKRVQMRLLEMGSAIANILENNNIPYMLALGTLLGAIRHEGFVPWDDDFDLFIFDEYYPKAKEAIRSNLPSDMFLEDENSEPLYFHSWAHVKDVETEAFCSEFPQDNAYSHKGVSVDLYRIKKMRANELGEYLYQENMNYLMRRKNKGLISDEEYKDRLEKQKHYYRCEDNREILGFVSSYNCKQMEIKDVFPLEKHLFEGQSFYIPKNPEKILTDIYGDYWELPPLERRRQHYSKVTFL